MQRSKQDTLETDIIFVVRVPVLSLQITVVQPSVSTDGRDLTMAFNLAIRFVPRARHLQNQNRLIKPPWAPKSNYRKLKQQRSTHVVTTAGSPSGIAATARATAI